MKEINHHCCAENTFSNQTIKFWSGERNDFDRVLTQLISSTGVTQNYDRVTSLTWWPWRSSDRSSLRLTARRVWAPLSPVSGSPWCSSRTWPQRTHDRSKQSWKIILTLVTCCQFHQLFSRAFFVQNFWCQNFKPKSQLLSFWRQNYVQSWLLGLKFWHQKFRTKHARVKRWWNWH